MGDAVTGLGIQALNRSTKDIRLGHNMPYCFIQPLIGSRVRLWLTTV
jgi:hypothetical protein